MTNSLEKRLKKLENKLNFNQKREKRIAKVVYDSRIYPGGVNLPSIDADVIKELL